MSLKKLTNTSRFPLLSSAALVLAVYGVILVFPFIQLQANAYETNFNLPNLGTPTQQPTATHATRDQLSGIDFSTLAQRYPSQSQPIVRQSKYQACPVPDIPKVSTTQQSETKTIHAINQWIACHNQRLVQLQTQLDNNIQLRLVRHTTGNDEQLVGIVNASTETFISEDKEEIEHINVRYAEWKKNSLEYKQRLGFRRNLLNLSEIETR